MFGEVVLARYLLSPNHLHLEDCSSGGRAELKPAPADFKDEVKEGLLVRQHHLSQDVLHRELDPALGKAGTGDHCSSLQMTDGGDAFGVRTALSLFDQL